MNNKQRQELFKEFKELEQSTKQFQLKRKTLNSVDEGSNSYLAGYFDGLIDTHSRRCSQILKQLEYKEAQ